MKGDRTLQQKYSLNLSLNGCNKSGFLWQISTVFRVTIFNLYLRPANQHLLLKRTFTILLACLFFYSSCIYYIIQLIELGQCHTAVISSHRSVRIRYLSLTPGSYETYGDDEIRFEGKMYDVIMQKAHRDKIIFCCVEDEREGAILACIQKHLFSFFGSTGKTAHTPLKRIAFHFDKISIIPQDSPPPVYEMVDTRHYAGNQLFFSFFDPSRIYHPPRQA
jgi:hypothetical protein